MQRIFLGVGVVIVSLWLSVLPGYGDDMKDVSLLRNNHPYSVKLEDGTVVTLKRVNGRYVLTGESLTLARGYMDMGGSWSDDLPIVNFEKYITYYPDGRVREISVCDRDNEQCPPVIKALSSLPLRVRPRKDAPQQGVMKQNTTAPVTDAFMYRDMGELWLKVELPSGSGWLQECFDFVAQKAPVGE